MEFRKSLKKLSADELLNGIKYEVGQERQHTCRVIDYLWEIYRREDYLNHYKDLYDFCQKRLGYTRGSAHRRITAMHLLGALPENEAVKTRQSLEKGELSLNSMTQLHHFIKEEKREKIIFTPKQKAKLLNQIKCKSSVQVERILAEISHGPVRRKPDKERAIKGGNKEVQFIASEKLVENLNRIRDLTAHSNPNPNYDELLIMITEEFLRKKDPVQRANRREGKSKLNMSKKNAKSRIGMSQTGVQSARNLKTNKNSTHRVSAVDKIVRVSQEDYDRVWKEADGKCQWQNCHTTYGLEVDHIIARALGGGSEFENLRLLCRIHNQYSWRRLESTGYNG